MTFPLQLPVIRREHYDGLYSILAAYLAEVIASLPFLMGMPALYTVVIYFMCGFVENMEAFFWCYLLNALSVLACTGTRLF